MLSKGALRARIVETRIKSFDVGIGFISIELHVDVLSQLIYCGAPSLAGNELFELELKTNKLLSCLSPSFYKHCFLLASTISNTFLNSAH